MGPEGVGRRSTAGTRRLIRAAMAAYIGVLFLSLGAQPITAGNVVIEPPYELTEFPLPLNSTRQMPVGITVGPFGNLWFTESEVDRIGRLDSDGMITEFQIPTPPNRPGLITMGGDGNLWFTEVDGGAIGRITPQGVITEFPLPSPFSRPIGITAGPDGNVWFTELGKIGRITPSGTVSEFTEPSVGFSIVSGPGMNLWFAADGRDRTHRDQRPETRVRVPERQPVRADGGPRRRAVVHQPPVLSDRQHDPRRRVPRDSHHPRGRGAPVHHPRTGRQPLVHHDSGTIGRVNQAGTVDRIVTLDESSGVADIVAGLDGGLWFTESSANKIGRVSSLAFLFTNLGDGAAPVGLARGSDDSIWFTAAGAHRVGRIDKDGSLVQFELGDGHTPVGIAVDDDGNAWFANQEANTIGRMTPDGELVTNSPSTTRRTACRRRSCSAPTATCGSPSSTAARSAASRRRDQSRSSRP